jgi:hypothetical protein
MVTRATTKLSGLLKPGQAREQDGGAHSPLQIAYQRLLDSPEVPKATKSRLWPETRRCRCCCRAGARLEIACAAQLPLAVALLRELEKPAAAC